jgi:AcrR family transcriptional regulator
MSPTPRRRPKSTGLHPGTPARARARVRARGGSVQASKGAASRRSGTPPTEDEEPITKRQRLVDACVSVVGDLGYRGARVSDICKVAGVTLRDFYACFASKDGCFAASFSFKSSVLVERGSRSFAEAAGPLEDRILRALDTVLGELAEDIRTANFMAEAANAGEAGDESIDAMVNVTRQLHLPRSEARRPRREFDDDVLLTAITGAIIHTIIAWVRTGRAEELRDVAPHLARYVTVMVRAWGS